LPDAIGRRARGEHDDEGALIDTASHELDAIQTKAKPSKDGDAKLPV
jgi:hypothetical protein